MTWTWKNEWNKITVMDGIIKWGRKRKMRQWLFLNLIHHLKKL
jgi:hypothetical protein